MGRLKWILFFIYLSLPASFAEITNLALNKKAYVRSYLSHYPPYMGLDGVVSLDRNLGYCFQPNAWFVVDLGSEYRVHYVVLYTRALCCGERTNNFRVGLLKEFDRSNFVKNQLCGAYVGMTQNKERYKLECTQPFRKYKFVFLYVPSTPQYYDMAFAEFEVYGDDKIDYSSQYVGCYSDLVSASTSTNVASVDQCIYICSNKTTLYAAIQGGECFCENTVSQLVSSSECSLTCSDDDHFCGAKNHYSVYRVKECRQDDKPVACTQHCKQSQGSDGCLCETSSLNYCPLTDCNSTNGLCGDNHCVSFSIGSTLLSECVCKSGYQKKLYYYSLCEDVDECKENNPCDQTTSTCRNNEGSFVCECKSGYEKSSGICQDIDECARNEYNCSMENEQCSNTIGSYECGCEEGFKKEKNVCEDVDECELNKCDNGTMNCLNNVGSYECVCKLEGGCSTAASVSGGTIAGAVIGVLVLVLIIVLLILYFFRRKIKQKNPENENDEELTENENCCCKISFRMDMFKKINKKIENSNVPDVYSYDDDVPMRNNTELCSVIDLNEESKNGMYQDFDIKLSLEDLDIFYNNNRKLIAYHFKKVPMISNKGIVEGKKQINKNKNHFEDIIPFDFNRVKLTGKNNDYINASYIKSLQPYSYRFIATQGVQNEEDVEDFWRMVVQEQVVVIIMLAPLLHNKEEKCMQYWPDSGEKKYGIVRVELKEVMKWPTFEIRKLLVAQKGNDVSLLVHLLFYLEWPDHGVPYNVVSLLNFHHKCKQLVQQKIDIKKDNAYESEEQAVNVIVQCSDGVGRTGTMIGIDCLIEEGKQSGFIEPFFCLKKLRRQRNKMIQNENQFLFCLKVLAVYGKIGNTTIYTKMNDALKIFMNGDQDKLNTALKLQIEFIQEKNQQKSDKEKKIHNKFLETFPGFSRPQAFRLCSIEDVSNSSFLDLLLDSCFVLVLHQHTMNKVNKLLPAPHQSITMRDIKVTRMNSVGGLVVQLKIEEKDSSKRNKPTKYQNSAIYAKSLTIECASLNNDVTQCYKHLRNQLQDNNEQPVLILYSDQDRQECLWSLVKFHLLEMMDKNTEVDVYQSVYNIYNCPSTTQNFNLDIDSYKQMYQFALDLLQKNATVYENETGHDYISGAYANDGYHAVDLDENAYLEHDNDQNDSQDTHFYEELKKSKVIGKNKKRVFKQQNPNEFIRRNVNLSIHPPAR